ncbi:MAG: cation transporter [Parvularculaceae bacterium]|nr:cation transporter [Parvularculaceae bacterium]
MVRSLLIALLAFPVAAQAQHHDDHQGADHDAHHMEGMHHGEQPAGKPIADTKAIKSALNDGGEPVVADVLGVVCDFCAKAMNKTFGKRKEVAAVYVDLDDKTLSLVLKSGASLSDETIDKLVKDAGYRIASIRRGDAALKEEAS